MLNENGRPIQELSLADRSTKLLVLILGVAILINLVGLTDYPSPHCDEIGSASIGYNFVTAGSPTMDAIGEYSSLPIRGGGFYYQYIVGAMLALLGKHLWVLRLSSSLGWLIATAFTYLIGRKLFDVRTGLLAATTFLTSLNVYWASHVARQEIWVIAVTLSILYLYLFVRERRTLWGYLLLGVATAHTAIGIHPNGLFFAAALVLVIVLSSLRLPSGWRWTLLYVLGGVIGSVTVVLIHLLPDPNAVLQTLALATDSHCSTPFCLPSLSLHSLAERLQAHLIFLRTAYWDAFNGFVRVFGLYTLVGIGYALIRGRSEDKMLLAIWGLSGALFALLLNYRNPMYAPLWDAFNALLIGVAVVGIAQWMHSHARRLSAQLSSGDLAILLILPLVATNLASEMWLTVKFSPRDFDAYLADVEALVPPGETVMGNITFWFSFNERDSFISDWYLAGFCGPACRPSDDLASTMRGLELDYVIDTGAVGCAVDPAEPYPEYKAYLVSECDEVGQVDNRWFGPYGHLGEGHPTTIYRCPLHGQD